MIEWASEPAESKWPSKARSGSAGAQVPDSRRGRTNPATLGQPQDRNVPTWAQGLGLFLHLYMSVL